MRLWLPFPGPESPSAESLTCVVDGLKDEEDTLGELEDALGELEDALGELEGALGELEDALGDLEDTLGELEVCAGEEGEGGVGVLDEVVGVTNECIPS